MRVTGAGLPDESKEDAVEIGVVLIETRMNHSRSIHDQDQMDFLPGCDVD